MPPVFTKSLADQLNKLSPLQVIEAPDGHVASAGQVLIAPGGYHMEISRDPNARFVVRLTDAPPVNSCRPAVDVLFRSAAACALRGVVSCILTGMGEDGAAGVDALHKACAASWCVSQDAASCVVYGMPAAVAQRGLSDDVLPLPAIAPRLNELFRC
jgi:two-component system chemotaxis response regulator CheB